MSWSRTPKRALITGGASGIGLAVADVTEEAGIQAGIDELAAAMGGIDTVVAAAGTGGEMGASISEVTTEGFRRVLEVNVLGVFHTVKFAVPFLAVEEQASVTLIGSDSGFVTAPGMLAHNSSQGARAQLTRALSFELYEDRGIRVNSVCPSIVDTFVARGGVGLENFDGVPYPVQPAQDVARSVLFLASEGSRAVNGVNLLSDFGYSTRSSFPA